MVKTKIIEVKIGECSDLELRKKLSEIVLNEFHDSLWKNGWVLVFGTQSCYCNRKVSFLTEDWYFLVIGSSKIKVTKVKFFGHNHYVVRDDDEKIVAINGSKVLLENILKL